jgi:hypothetical protein
MGCYVDLTAKRGCEAQINEAYARWVDDPNARLVFTEAIVAHEIAYIHSPAGESRAHLRPHLKTIADWERVFPILKLGTGQFKVSGIEENDPDFESGRRDLEFVLEHRMLFERITGLDDAREIGLTDFPHDLIERHQGKQRVVEEVRFADLPHSTTQLYKRCVEHGRADIWAAYLAFKRSRSWDSWLGLRDKVVPWPPAGFTTVWQLAETQASLADGQEYGLTGRFQNGRAPSFDLIRIALR